MTQNNKEKPIVFVSHVEEDAEVASKIKTWLEENLLGGVEVFTSSDEGIKPGDKWEELIIEKLRTCSTALVVCTQMSIRQPWINFEAGGAWVKGGRVIPLCYHGQKKDTLPRPLSSLQALDLSEPDDINELLKIIAKDAGLRAPNVNPIELIKLLPQRNYDELSASGKLPDIKVKVGLSMIPDGRFLINLEAENHDTNSVFLGYPYIEINNSTDKITFVREAAYNSPVPTGELKPGDARSVLVDPAKLSIDADLLREVTFPDKIGRKFKGSPEDTLNVIKSWKNAMASRKNHKA